MDSDDSNDNEDEVIDLQEINEDLDTKNEPEDKGQLDEQAIARLKAQEECTDDQQKQTVFEEIDFHPDEPRPPNTLVYSAYMEGLRHTMNTYLRRPIQNQFSTNTKKCIITVERNVVYNIEDCYDLKEDEYFEKAEQLLQAA